MMTTSNSLRWTLCAVSILGSILFSNPAFSLAVTKSSSCAETCGDNGITFPTDLVCTDSAFNEMSKGSKLKNCLLCESTSTAYGSPTQNDIYWFLFNQKYILQTCLFDREPDVSLSPCESPCLPLKPVFKTLWYQDGWIPQYEYCDMGGGALETYAGDCADCLRGKNGSVFLGNFMDTLEAGCRSKPNATKGETVKLRQALFAAEISSSTTSASTTATSAATSTSNTAASTASGTSATSVPGATEEPKAQSETKSTGLSAGAAAGIGVGASAGGLILIAALVWVFFLRRRRGQGNEKQIPKWNDESTSSLKFDGPPREMSTPEFANRRELQGRPRAELPTS